MISGGVPVRTVRRSVNPVLAGPDRSGRTHGISYGDVSGTATDDPVASGGSSGCRVTAVDGSGGGGRVGA